MKIVLQPFGQVPQRVLEELKDDLGAFPAEVRVADTASLPSDAFDPERSQYRAEVFREACDRVEGDRVLGIAAVDLYAEPLNFVFGEATVGGRAAVISIARLSNRDRSLFRDRISKEAIHELGHTLGLPHCRDASCVMHFSNTLDDTDVKGKEYCADCTAALPRGWTPKRR